MAVRDEIKEQTVKFKEMSLEQKIDYIYTYYKWWIIITLAVIFVVTSTVKVVIENSKPVYLGAVFLNSPKSAISTQITLEEEFIASQKVDGTQYKSEFDYVTYLDNDYGNQQSMAGQVKLVSRYSAEQLDIVCGPDDVLSGAGDVGGYGNLEELLPAGMLDELIEKGYEPYYYTEKIYDDDAQPDADGNRPYTDGDSYIGGIYINNCKKLFGTGSTCVYDESVEDRMVLAIAWNVPHLDHAIEFIKFVTE